MLIVRRFFAGAALVVAITIGIVTLRMAPSVLHVGSLLPVWRTGSAPVCPAAHYEGLSSLSVESQSTTCEAGGAETAIRQLSRAPSFPVRCRSDLVTLAQQLNQTWKTPSLLGLYGFVVPDSDASFSDDASFMYDRSMSPVVDARANVKVCSCWPYPPVRHDGTCG